MTAGRAAAATAALAVLAGGVLLPATAVAAQSVTEGQWWHEQWRMDEVWPMADGSGVTVAVLDSGVDASIPELAGAVLAGTDLGTGGDGRVDHDTDRGGHGTAMASLIAGNGTGSGMRGVAPGASILPVAVFEGDDFAGGDAAGDREATVAEAIRWATDNGADVISMSIATGGQCTAELVQAVRYAVERDAILVASSGNNPHSLPDTPGSCPGVLTVGATDSVLEPWANSHRSEFVDVTGPGVYISAVGTGGRVRYGNGTSDATALVSGAIALVRSHFPDASADEVLRRILATARDLPADSPDGWDEATGYGIVRPYQALTEQVPPDAPNPVFAELAEASAPPEAAAPEIRPPGDSGGESDSESRGMALGLAVLGVGALLLVGVVVGVAMVLLRQRSSGPRP